MLTQTTTFFEGEFQTASCKSGIREIARLVCRGGWPAALDMDESMAADLPAQYLNALFEVSAAKAGLSPRTARRTAVSLARNADRAVTFKTLFTDVFEEGADLAASPATYQQRIDPYVSFFRGQYFIEELPGWDAPVKSRSRVRRKPKRTFADPSLPASLLGMAPERLLAETQVFGTLFEGLCLRDVRVYASALGQMPEPAICYYADADGLEVDIIVELADGRWGGVRSQAQRREGARGGAEPAAASRQGARESRGAEPGAVVFGRASGQGVVSPQDSGWRLRDSHHRPARLAPPRAARSSALPAFPAPSGCPANDLKSVLFATTRKQVVILL